MRLLMTEPSMGVWETNYPGETAKPLPVSLGWPCMPCACQSCQQTRQCVCLDQKTHAVISSMPAPPGVSGMLFSPCGRWLYQLSSEADCIHTRLTATGELLYAMPCGLFPRCRRMIKSIKSIRTTMTTNRSACKTAIILSLFLG